MKDDEYDGIGRQCAGYIKSSAGSRFSLYQIKFLGLVNAIALDSERIVVPRQIADREIVANVVAVNDFCPRRQEPKLCKIWKSWKRRTYLLKFRRHTADMRFVARGDCVIADEDLHDIAVDWAESGVS